jgi:hypothetical protein
MNQLGNFRNKMIRQLITFTAKAHKTGQHLTLMLHPMAKS